MAEQRPLETVISDLRDQADGDGVSVGDFVAALEDRSLGGLLAVLGFLLLVPVVGGLPGAPVVVSVLILGAVAQSFLQSGGLWLPGVVRERRVDADRLRGFLDRAEPWAERVDRLTGHRLGFLAESRAARLAIVGCVVVLALSLIFLGLVPAGIVPAALGILVFGLALMARDGVLVLIGYAMTGAAIWAGTTLI